MKTPDILQAIQPVISAINKLSIPYYIGGSIASSIYGIARATMDVDIVADIRPNYIPPLKQILENEYYIDENMIKDAIQRLSSFNLIHLETMIKIDVFIHNKRQLFAEESLRRKQRDTLEDSKDAPEFYFSSPEDIIINKLQWYEMGNRISERQLLDVLGVIKVQSKNLDKEYLRIWGENLGLLDLLTTAFQEAGFDF